MAPADGPLIAYKREGEVAEVVQRWPVYPLKAAGGAMGAGMSQIQGHDKRVLGAAYRNRTDDLRITSASL